MQREGRAGNSRAGGRDVLGHAALPSGPMGSVTASGKPSLTCQDGSCVPRAPPTPPSPVGVWSPRAWVPVSGVQAAPASACPPPLSTRAYTRVYPMLRPVSPNLQSLGMPELLGQCTENLAGAKSILSSPRPGTLPPRPARERPGRQSASLTASLSPCCCNGASSAGAGKPDFLSPRRIPWAQRVRAPSQAEQTSRGGGGVFAGDPRGAAPALGQRAGPGQSPQVKRSARAGLGEWRKIPLEGNRGEFPHDLHTVGASPLPAPGRGAAGQEPSSS